MKKIIILLASLAAATACDWFVFDNQEGWNAQVEGRILDSKTGDPVQFAWPNTSSISIIEEGWDMEKAQTWYVKCNGTYRNNLVWAGKYRMETRKQNFYPVSLAFELKEGPNTVDFTVTPYARIIDPVIAYEGNRIVARFKVEVSDASLTPNVDIALFGFTDRWVSDANNNFNFDSVQTAGRKKKVSGTDGNTTFELSIDPTKESGNQFTYKRTHFLRIGAVAYGSKDNTAKCYNYSPVYKMTGDFSRVEEVTGWDEE